jgi:hypothetical protein
VTPQLVQRHLLRDDSRGVGENLAEGGWLGDVAARHLLLVNGPDDAATAQRIEAARAMAPPVVAFGGALDDFEGWTSVFLFGGGCLIYF